LIVRWFDGCIQDVDSQPSNNQAIKQSKHMFKENTFKDKVALVTGGRSGIGYQIAKDLLQMGAKVVICSRKEALLVNNAGGQFPTLAEYTNNKGWNAVINNNLNGTFYMTRDMAKYFFLPQKSGVIINIIADIFRGFPGMVHTGAARAGVENMTKTLAVEWSQSNIRINCVAPGTIESSGLSTYPQAIQDTFEEGRKANPLKRFGTVEDVSNSVCFLASSLASYTTGITLYVDGAQHLHSDKMALPGVIKSFMK